VLGFDVTAVIQHEREVKEEEEKENIEETPEKKRRVNATPAVEQPAETEKARRVTPTKQYKVVARGE